MILFHHEGGVDIGDVDSKASRLEVQVEETMQVSLESIKTTLLTQFTGDKNLVGK